jgi:hypothetical protein
VVLLLFDIYFENPSAEGWGKTKRAFAVCRRKGTRCKEALSWPNGNDTGGNAA